MDCKMHFAPEPQISKTERSEIISITAVCRLCAGQSERFIGIFSEEGITNDLSNKINLYLPIKVSLNDSMPLQCCLNCASTILAWHELVVTSVEADRKFQNCHFINQKQIKGDEDFENVGPGSVTSDENDRLDPESLPSLNDFCQTEDLKPPTTTKDLKRLKKQDIITYFPPQETSNLETYITQMDHHFIVDPLVDNPDTISEYKVENVVTEDDKKPASDEDIFDSSYFSCKHCSALFIMKKDVVTHIQNDHPGQEILVVPVVDQVQDQIANTALKKERRRNNKIDQDMTNAAKVVVDGRVYYNCKECGKSLHSPYTYVWHMRIHTGERPYVCDLCGKQFRVSQGLVRHLRETHQGIKKFPCDLCGRMFATRRNVEEHRRIHTNERPYVCDLCGKSFKQKASLFVHKRSHKNYFPFKCSYCNQGFRTKPPLMVHITRHTGEKPYKCDICGRCFRIKYELKRHRLIHSDEKPFVCNLCGLSFRQKRYLRNHTKSNHTAMISCRSSDDTETKEPEDKRIEKPRIGDFQCNTCNKPFRTRIGLKRHIKWCKESPGSCTICNKTFARDWDLKRHKKSCTIVPEETNKIFDKIANLITKTCTKCDLKFENSTKLKQHVKDKHNIIYKRKRRKGDEIIAQFFCDICKKGYTRKFDMEKHRSKAHSGLPPLKNNGELTRRKENMILFKQSKFKDLEGKIYYKCDFCEKHFTQSYNLMRHRTIHTGVRSYFCHICGKSFRISNGLTRHIDNYHKGLKRFSCDVCGKKFAARATRDEHMNIHNNYRPFICDKCGKCFKQKATLNIHKMFHTDQFKFLCSTCGKKFRRAQELKVHTWLHTGHKPYACKECPAVFRLGQELKRHLKVHERVGECVCGDCGSVFTQERYLKIHRKIHVNNRAVNIEIVPVK